MMTHVNFRRSVIAGALVLTSMVAATPVIAAQADLDALQSYVGDWRGTGTMENSGQPTESVRCQLGVTKSTSEKINFNGRCALAGATLSIAGTMAYISAANRYEAVMTSNTSFSGNAIGRRRGSNVTFNLQSTDANGDTANVRAGLGLINGNISVSFQITNADGSKIVAQVPFDRD